MSDPRIERTRAHVLAQARELIAAQGIGSLTYAALAARARVARPTLYRHWPTSVDLLSDLLLSGPATDYPIAGPDAEQTVRAFLGSLRDAMDDPALGGAMSALIGAAEHDEAARAALHSVATDRLIALNELLEPSGVRIDGTDLAQLAGAVLFRRFIARLVADDEFLDDVVARWVAARR